MSKDDTIKINFDPERIPATTLCALTQFVRAYNDLRTASQDLSDATTGLIVSTRALSELGEITEVQRNGLQAILMQMMGATKSVAENYTALLRVLAERHDADGQVEEWADLIG